MFLNHPAMEAVWSTMFRTTEVLHHSWELLIETIRDGYDNQLAFKHADTQAWITTYSSVAASASSVLGDRKSPAASASATTKSISASTGGGCQRWVAGLPCSFGVKCRFPHVPGDKGSMPSLARTLRRLDAFNSLPRDVQESALADLDGRQQSFGKEDRTKSAGNTPRRNRGNGQGGRPSDGQSRNNGGRDNGGKNNGGKSTKSNAHGTWVNHKGIIATDSGDESDDNDD
jgi:hypothetical protein